MRRNPTRLGELRLQACGNIDAITIDVVAFDNNIAKVDTDSQHDGWLRCALVRRRGAGFAAGCPLGEFCFAHEPGLQPRGLRLIFDLNIEGLGLGLQRLHLFVQRSQHLTSAATAATLSARAPLLLAD